MLKKLLLILLFVTLVTACNTETPEPVLPAATPPAQDVQPSAYPEPVSPTLQPVDTAYPAPSVEAVRPGSRPAAPENPTPYPYPEPQTQTGEPSDPQQQVRALADQVVQAFKDRNLQSMAILVHPGNGLRFSPYSYVRPEDLTFRAVELPDMLEEPAIYEWGFDAGSGEAIKMPFTDYFNRYVYDQDYASAPQVSINERLGPGSSIDNAAEFYPGSIVVEYHFPGFDQQYQGLDWRSLRLVFEDYMGRWVLSGVIHDEWTP
jgi:hypothetical protein